jgi:hypothetical protein
VQIILSKICSEVESGYSKSIDKIRQELVSKGDQQILEFMEPEIERKKRYLDNIIEDSSQSMEEEKKS